MSADAALAQLLRGEALSVPSSVAASSFAAAASSSGSGNGSAALLLHCAAAVLPATAAPLARAQLSWAAATHGGLAAACDAEAVEVALAAVAAAADALCAPPSVAEASDAPSVPTATLAAALASLDARGESLCAAATATGSSEAAASAMSVRARGHDVRARLLLALSSAAGDNDDAVTSGNVAAAAAAELRAARRYWQAAKVVLVSPSQSQALTVASATGVLGSRTPPRQASSASGSLSPSANRLSIRRTASPAVEADSETVAMDPAALLQQTACAAAAAASVAVADEAERELASRAAASAAAAAAEDDSALVRRLLAPLSSLAPPVAAALAVLPPSHFILWATERGLSGRTDEAEAALLLAGRSAVPQSAGGGGGGGENCSARLLAVSRLHGLAVHVCARRGRFAAAARLLQIALRLALPSSAEEAAAAGGDASLASTLVAGINAAEAAESVAIAAAQARFLSALKGPESVGATPPATCPAPAPRALPSPWPLRLVVALAVQHLRSGAAGAAREALEWAAAASPALAASPLTLLRLAECSLAEAAAASATAKGSLPGEVPPASPYTSRFASDTQTPRSGVASGCGGSGPTVAVTQREDLLTQEPPPPPLVPPPSLPATATTDVAAVDELAPVPPSCAGKVALVRARALLVRCLAALRAQQAALPAASATSPRNTNPCAAETLTSLLRVSLRSGRGVRVGIGGGAGNDDSGEGISVGGDAVFETPQEPDGSGDAFFAPSPPDESPSPLAVHMLASGAADVVPIDAALPAVAASAASSAAAPAAGVFLSSPARLRRLEAACLAKLAWTQLANGEAARAARTTAQLLNGPVASALTPDEAASARAVAAAAAAAVEAIALG